MIKTPLRYPGGKSRVAEYLVNLFPPYKQYREPFLGGGSVWLAAIQNCPEADFIINDLYYDLYCFWMCMLEDSDEVVFRATEIKKKYGDGRLLYDDMIRIMNESRVSVKYVDPYEIASCFFVLNRITFSGTSLSGGYSEESFKKRFTDSSIERLKSVGNYLKKFGYGGRGCGRITCSDFKELFIFEQIDVNDVFMFLDPPYYTAEDSALYGENGDMHKGFDHLRLKECIDGCNCKFLMTYDDCEYIRNLYRDYYIIPFEFSYGMRNVSKDADMKGKEILISNYRIKDNSKSIELF